MKLFKTKRCKLGGLWLTTALSLMGGEGLLSAPHPAGFPYPVANRAIVQLQGLEVAAPQVKGTATVPLKLLENSQVFTTTVKVGTLPGRFLIDTGASTTLVSPALADTLKLSGRAVPGDRLSTAVAGKDCRTMKATLHSLPPLVLQSVEIRGASGLSFEGTAIPDGLSGVLGMDVLQRFDLRFSPQNSTLQLAAPSRLPAADLSIAVPLQKKLGVFLAQLTLNGQGPFTMLLDTGADSTFISQAVAQRLQLKAVQPIQILGFCGLEPAQASRVTSAKLQQHEQIHLETIIVSSPILKMLGVDGILGQNFLGQYQQHWRFTPYTQTNGTLAAGSLLLTKMVSGTAKTMP